MRLTQKERVLRHLAQFKTITPIEAMRDYGCMRLGARCYDLKEEGWPVTSTIKRGTNRFGEPTHWAEYSLDIGSLTNTQLGWLDSIKIGA